MNVSSLKYRAPVAEQQFRIGSADLDDAHELDTGDAHRHTGGGMASFHPSVVPYAFSAAPLRTLVVEAQPLLRLGLRQILDNLAPPASEAGLDEAGLAAMPEDAATTELLIYGLELDTDADWAVLADLHRTLAPQRILLLSDATLPEAWRADAGRLPIRGLVAKRASIAVIEATIRLILAGGDCFPSGFTLQGAPRADDMPVAPAPAAVAAKAAAGLPASVKERAVRVLNITPRQYDILALFARGHSIKAISRILNISVATAKTHSSTLYQRLRVCNKGEAVYAARQRGVALE